MNVPPPVVLEQLDRILRSATFRGVARSRTLLKFLVVETVEGRADRLKDYTLGAEALGRGEAFDPRTDPIARVEASRLRSKLDVYYATEGAADPVIIALPKGGYVPQFREREQPVAVLAAPEAPPSRGRKPWLFLAIGAAATAVLLVPVALLPDAGAPPVALDTSYFPSPSTFDPTSLAIAPDGQSLVVVGSEHGIARLFLRRFSAHAWELLPGTEGASLPFWSPNSDSIGFFARTWIQRIDLATGVIRPVARIGVPGGAAWSRNDTIVFQMAPDGPLWKAPVDGGTARPVTRFADRQTGGHRAPSLLPDGRHFLFYVAEPGARGIYLGSFDDGTTRFVVRSDSQAVYAQGHLLYVEQGTLFARPFDPAQPGEPGPARALSGAGEEIAVDATSGIAAFSASESGVVVYRMGSGGKRQLVTVRGDGTEVARIGAAETRGPYYPSLSHDGTRLAVQRSRNGNTDILVLDLRHRGAERYVTDAATPDIAAVWAPTGDRLAYSARGKSSPFDLFITSLTGERELLFASDHAKQATDWSGDGKMLLFRSIDPETFDMDVWALPLGGETFPVVSAAGDDRDAQLSPGAGRFVVYQSERHDVPNIYVQRFPSGDPQPVSRGGGVHPRWSRNGRAIYYIDLEGWLVAVPFTAASSGSTFELGETTRLFRPGVGHLRDIALPHYVVVNDNEFLVDEVVEEVPPPVVRMLNALGSS
jgi:hypothetical protein